MYALLLVVRSYAWSICVSGTLLFSLQLHCCKIVSVLDILVDVRVACPVSFTSSYSVAQNLLLDMGPCEYSRRFRFRFF